MKKITVFSLLTSLIFSTLNGATLEQVKPGFAKNVIFLIPNGSSSSLANLARWTYNEGKPLNLDSIASGMVRTHSADSPIADTISAANAMATGWKTQEEELAYTPTKGGLFGSRPTAKGEELYPVASVLEAAKLSGKAIGLVVTSEVQNATPGAFTSHVTSWDNYRDITEQQVYQDMDVILGGGLTYLKKDKDFTEEIKAKGYELVYNLNSLKKAKRDKVWGIFAPVEMIYDLDRNKDRDPSLAQMTSKAIDILSQNKNGFFLVVEGSKIDEAAHTNATIAQTSEFIAFDRAVGEALEFAKKNKNTLVVVASTHSSSGMTMGNSTTNKSYSKTSVEDFTKILKNAKSTEEKVAKMIIKNPQFAKGIIKDNLGISASDSDVKKIKNIKNIKELQIFLGTLVAKSSNIGYTTMGHTADDVILYVYYPDVSQILTGTVQNSDLALYAAKALNLNLAESSKKLFVPGTSLKPKGLNLKIDDTDKNSIEFTITNPKERDRKEYVFLKNHNYFEADGVRHYFNGVVVYNGKEVFFPEEAIDLILPPPKKATQKKKKSK